MEPENLAQEMFQSFAESPEATETTDIVNEPQYAEDSGQEQVIDSQEQVQSAPEEIEDTYFTLPQNFENQEMELNWYKERFNKIQSSVNLSEQELQQYRERELEQYTTEQRDLMEGYKEMFLAIQTNPRGFFAQHFPEVMQEMGVSPILTEQQIADELTNRMVQTFGPTYRDRYNANDLIDPHSESSQMFRMINETTRELQIQNKRNEEILQNWNSRVIKNEIHLPTESEVKANIESAYETEFAPAGFSREQYDQFVNDVRNTQITPIMLHRALYAETYLKGAYNKGFEAGKKSTYSQAVQSGARTVTPTSQPEPAQTMGTYDRRFMENFAKGKIMY